ncbi:MAG: alcohol dehydrogenase catalytic domain-containing protein [Phycisphaerae bacterium]
MNATQLPETQHALQLVGPDELELNHRKAVNAPTASQILLKVEAVGLCFSDLKLLHQFDQHPRKAPVESGVDPAVLNALPSYCPGDQPTVPGHEVVATVAAVGPEVKQHKVGERIILQADTRQLKTAKSNGAYGYNMEGGLQEYFLTDEKIAIYQGQRFLMPVSDDRNAAAVALVEPWACVECSYVTKERQTIKPGSRLLVVADAGRQIRGLSESFSSEAAPSSITCKLADAQQSAAIDELGIAVRQDTDDLAALADEEYDDIVYFGSDKATLDTLNDKLAARGICNVVLAGERIGAEVSVGVGRVHYGMTRWIGTLSADASESYSVIPEIGEIRDGDRILVVGAGGPMGQMHVIRNICSGKSDLEVVATDFDDARLESLTKKAGPFAADRGVEYSTVNPQNSKPEGKFSYIALMAPVGQLVANAIADSDSGCVINIFAGIPVATKHELDLDTYIANRCFMFGTSGSTIHDMEIVREKVETGQLDTNCSVDAVCGMEGAAEGIEAVKNRSIAGKIIVYPQLEDMGLIPLEKLAEVYPQVAEKLADGMWTAEAEEELLQTVGK